MINSESQSIVAKRRRCTVCGTKRLKRKGDGRMVCKYGHEQLDYVDEATLQSGGGTRERVVKKKGRTSKNIPKLYGERARFLLLQALQVILQKQIEILINKYGAPAALTKTVRNLWLIYVTKLEGIEIPVDGDEDDEDGDGDNNTNIQSSNIDNTLTAEDMYSQYMETNDLDAGDAMLNDLVQGVDDLISADERESKRRKALLSENSKRKATTESKTADPETSESIFDEAGLQKSVPIDLIRCIKIEYLPALIYLGFVWLDYPITIYDIYRIVAEERIPYISALQHLPTNIRKRMGSDIIRGFITRSPPSMHKLFVLSSKFVAFFEECLALKFPIVNASIRLLSFVKRLNLDIRFYHIAIRIIELSEFSTYQLRLGTGMRPVRHVFHTDAILMASLVIALKLHYGFDEAIRSPTKVGAQYMEGIPPLDKFIEQWRDEWAGEFTIASFPNITELHGPWYSEFVGYSQRVIKTPNVECNKRHYDDLSNNYEVFLDSLATKLINNTSQAKLLLPQNIYAAQQRERGMQHSNELHTQGISEGFYTSISQEAEALKPSQHDSDALSKTILKRLVPLEMPKLPATERRRKRPYTSVASTLRNYSKPQFYNGEKYVSHLHDRIPMVYKASGYISPLLGVVVNRCAMIIGSPPVTLLSAISSIEEHIKVRDMTYFYNYKWPFRRVEKAARQNGP